MATWYVDPAAGSDANAGTSQGAGNAWQTITHAIATVSAGDTIYVKGTCNELVDETTKSFSPPVQIVGYTSTPGDGGSAAIDGQNTRSYCIQNAGSSGFWWRNFILKGATSRLFNWTANGGFHRFDNCRFTQGSASSKPHAWGSSNFSLANPTTFWYCEIDNCADLLDGNSYNIEFHGCTIHDLNGAGIGAASFRGGITAIDNLIYNCTAGIIIGNNDGNNVIIANTIYNVTGDGISIDPGSDTGIIRSNVCGRIGGYGLKFINAADASQWVVDGNGYYSCTSGFYNTNAIVGPHDVTISGSYPTNDPFVDSTNLKLAIASGSAWRAAAFPGLLLQSTGGPTQSYRDIGAVQHQDAGGGGSSIVIQRPIVANTYALIG